MKWHETALRAAHEHEEREQAQARAEAEDTVVYVHRLLDQWEVPDSDRDNTGLAFGVYAVDLGHVTIQAEVTRDRPVVTALREFDGVLHDCGPVETLTDLGRVLDLAEPPDWETEDDDPDAGDLLLTVMRGLVRDVVAEELDGRLGDGGP